MVESRGEGVKGYDGLGLTDEPGPPNKGGSPIPCIQLHIRRGGRGGGSKGEGDRGVRGGTPPSSYGVQPF